MYTCIHIYIYICFDHGVVKNDFRPVALTSTICKCLERLVCNQLTTSLSNRLDPLQFAYKAKRGVEDATLHLMNFNVKALDKPGTFVRILMMDFSSAFNTLQTHILIKRLLDLDVTSSLVLWIKSFLSDRPQRVNVNGTLSNEIVINTGAPQGCVLSPLLFSIYTNELMCNTDSLLLVKFADDMALAAVIRDKQSLSDYFIFVNRLIICGKESYLILNVKKTKELCLEEKRVKSTDFVNPVLIDCDKVEQVDNFKYLGTILDKNFTFTDHVDTVCKKASQRLHFLRKMKCFGMNCYVL